MRSYHISLSDISKGMRGIGLRVMLARNVKEESDHAIDFHEYSGIL